LIDVWPVGELALFDTNEWRRPANDFAVVIPAKADLAEAVSDELAVETNESAEGDAQATVATAAKAEPLDSTDGDTELPVIEEAEMDETEIKKMVDEQVKAALEAAAPVVKSAPAQKRVTEMGFSDEPKAAFTHWVKTGDSGGVKALVKGALQEATNEGLELTPDAFFPGIVEKRDEASIIRQPALGVQRYTTNARVFDIPAEGTSMTKFSQVAEEGAISAAENEPTFSTIAVTLYKFRKLVKVSEELLADDQTRNLETFLNNAAGRALADTENYYTLIGNGTTAPQGVFVGGTAGLTLDSATAIGPAEIPELFYKLAQPYRDNAYWVMAGDTEAYLRGLAGSTSFYYNPNPVTVGPMGWQNLLGRPVINNSNCATKQASAKTLLIGNWAYYGFVERETIRVQRLVELYAGTGQIGLSFGVRFGGMVTQAEAFQYAMHPTA
jgi:HK97 family phage major capsid protein